MILARAAHLRYSREVFLSWLDHIGEMFRFSWKWRRRSPIKLMERMHEEATQALRAGREGRHPAATFAAEGAHLQAVRRSGTPADRLLPLAEGALRERGLLHSSRKHGRTNPPSRSGSRIWKRRSRPRTRFWPS